MGYDMATTKDTIKDMTRVMIIMVEAVAEADIAAMNWRQMSNHQSLWMVTMMRNLDQSILRLATLRSHLVISCLVIWRNQRAPSQRSNFNQFMNYLYYSGYALIFCNLFFLLNFKQPKTSLSCL